MSAVDTRLVSFARAGLTFRVTDTGPLDGTPVVLLHGFPQTAAAWEPTARLLHETGHRTYAPDQRGYSPGARPRGRRAHRLTELLDDVAALIDHIGRPVVLVGHDWGAAVAWAVAMHRPELVDRLVALSVPHPAAFFASMVRSNQLAMSWYMGFFNLPFVPERLTRDHGWMRGWLERSGMGPEALQAWQRDFLDAGCLPGALGWYRALPFLTPSQVRVEVTVPTTFIWSAGDFALGGSGARLTERYVTGPYEYVELPANTHWLLEEVPAEIARAVTG